MHEITEEFIKAANWAVAGVSKNPEKYGYKVYFPDATKEAKVKLQSIRPVNLAWT